MLHAAPIRQKLMTMILVTSSVVLVLTCAAFLSYEFLTFRKAAARQLATLGDIIAAESTGAVAFDNQHDATEVLSALRAEKHVIAACLYDRHGRIFARYPAEAPDAAFPVQVPPDGQLFVDGYLQGSTPLIQVKGSDRFGTLFLRSDLEAVRERLRLYGGIAVLVIIGASLVAYVLSRALQRQISRPIDALATTARAVSDRRDYSVRAAKMAEDELGLLTEAFNHMLARIEEQNAELERRVRERTAELEAANDELEAFCSSAAHDLRTPLRAITGFTEVLLDPRANIPPEEVKRYVASIQNGSTQMSQLIEDLLSFSRVGRQELARKPIDLETICRSVITELIHGGDALRIRTRVGKLPEVFADAALLRIVFVNLLSNAIKYSRDRNPALIEIGVAPAESADGPVIFVSDNGVGFNMADAEKKLFVVFQRLHHAHEFEGTGVGLATVRRIVERHGGRIWVEATPNKGVTFYFQLPRSPAGIAPK